MAGERNTVGSRERVLEDGLRLWDARAGSREKKKGRRTRNRGSPGACLTPYKP